MNSATTAQNPMQTPRPILIVRTVSLEKLSFVLDLCRERWPQHPIHIISSENRLAELQNDARITETHTYKMGKTGFDHPFDYSERAAALIIPIANQRGSGYGNVFKAFSSVKADAIFLAAHCKKLSKSTPYSLKLKYLFEQGARALSRPLAHCWAKSLLKNHS